jgi:ribosome-associated toxin RatA of RatAB toxin-antitoxin module
MFKVINLVLILLLEKLEQVLNYSFKNKIMKKIILTALSILAFVSCQSDDAYENRNIDPKNPLAVDADFLFNSATKSLVDQMTSTNVNTNIFRMLGQHWTETSMRPIMTSIHVTLPMRIAEIYRDVLLDLSTSKSILMQTSFVCSY